MAQKSKDPRKNNMNEELRDLIIRIDERVRALTEKLDSFMENTKQNYLCKEQFRSWESDEFVPVKEKVKSLNKLQWIVVSSIVAMLGSIILRIAHIL